MIIMLGETELRKRRKALGLTQMDLARLVGVSLVTIQTWERGIGTPKPENLEKLEEVLGELEKSKMDTKQGRTGRTTEKEERA